MTQKTKTCTLCREAKALSEFSPNGPRPHARCKPCRSAVRVEWQRDNADAHNAKLRKWRQDRPHVARAIVSRYTKRHLGKKAAYSRKWRAANAERYRRSTNAWRERSRHVLRERKARRRAAELAATPWWASPAAMAAIYAEALCLTAATGIPHEVDHIIPLQSDVVCGLHCEMNLRVVTRAINRSKSNRLIEDLAA